MRASICIYECIVTLVVPCWPVIDYLFTLRLSSYVLFGDLLFGSSCCFLSKHECWKWSRHWCTGGWVLCPFSGVLRGGGWVRCLCIWEPSGKYSVRMPGCKPVCCKCVVSVTGHRNIRKWWYCPWFGLCGFKNQDAMLVCHCSLWYLYLSFLNLSFIYFWSNLKASVYSLMAFSHLASIQKLLWIMVVWFISSVGRQMADDEIWSWIWWAFIAECNFAQSCKHLTRVQIWIKVARECGQYREF